ncbi:MAG: phosphoribosylpyrophosphate synthetase [Syntrophobacteraceae bacterium CG2_30_61_12]|nr:MAG: phosphoribosylpyrophosphate synthetase [Syntrophobacteraceae bacterium CG2_30_61_12]PIU31901.1 MAG: phosphoribosylpyrophosphate synthetase [Syntrophobacteraceae bacterium CG07_land_8_20_14_0_80_61_8]
MGDTLKIFCGSSNLPLATEVCRTLGTAMGHARIGRFADGEVRIELQDNVRGKDVYIIQSACRPVNDHLVELLIMIDAIKRASAQRINAVMPYYGYARQDQKDRPRTPIAARMVADLLCRAGVQRFVAMDLHARQVQGFFDIPVDDIAVLTVFVDDLKPRLAGREVVLAPDSAGVARARTFAEALNLDLAILDFRKASDDDTLHVVGNVAGRPVIIVDDMVDSARTLERSARAAAAVGAAEINAYCVHPVLSQGAGERLQRAPIRSLTVTDTIPLTAATARHPKIRVVSIAPILADVIRKLHLDEPLNHYLH